MKNILYVNACIKREVESRTNCLAQAYLKKCLEGNDCKVTTIVLENTVMAPLTGKILSEREQAIEKLDFSGPLFDLAKTFAVADEVVISAPYYDLSFPANLKLYIEQLCINKLTFCYNEKGIPCNLTNVKKVVYFTTAGGYIGNNNFGFEYVKALAENFFGIEDVKCFTAEGLDIFGADVQKIMNDAKEHILDLS